MNTYQIVFIVFFLLLIGLVLYIGFSSSSTSSSNAQTNEQDSNTKLMYPNVQAQRVSLQQPTGISSVDQLYGQPMVDRVYGPMHPTVLV